ncbi:MAG: hypothetical protein ICV65_01035 [Flavisolibacter sp.]|nr:hypothetical protein [Flavisolibacter sp.]
MSIHLCFLLTSKLVKEDIMLKAMILTTVSHGFNVKLKKHITRPFMHLVRWLLLNLYYGKGYMNHFNNLPDRKWIKTQLSPKLEKINRGKILYVGCAPYSWDSLKSFNREVDLFTVDNKMRNVIWGGEKHIVADIQNIDKMVQPASFDMVLLNGIFGYGIDTEAAQTITYQALHSILKPDGLLLIGWNYDRSTDPLKNTTCRHLFTTSNYEDLESRTCFEDSTHVFDFLRAKPIVETGFNKRHLERCSKR